MTKVGIKREIDATGRLCVPKEMRELFKLSGEVELIVTPEGVLLRNPEYVLMRIAKEQNES